MLFFALSLSLLKLLKQTDSSRDAARVVLTITSQLLYGVPWVGWRLALWLAAVVVWLLWGVGFGFVLWVSVGGVVCWCGRFWFWVGVWGGPGSANGPNST